MILLQTYAVIILVSISLLLVAILIIQREIKELRRDNDRLCKLKTKLEIDILHMKFEIEKMQEEANA